MLAQQAGVGESLLDWLKARQEWQASRLDYEVRQTCPEFVSLSRQIAGSVVSCH